VPEGPDATIRIRKRESQIPQKSYGSDRIPDSNELDFDLPSEILPEPGRKRNTGDVLAFVELICELKLLSVVFRKQTALRHKPGEGTGNIGTSGETK
jgi:hypothetical protein